MKRQSLVLVLSLCAVSAAMATTYVRVEKDGTKTYSDRPIPGGQPVDLQPAQTYSTPPSAVSSNSQRPREQELLQQTDAFRYESCRVSPENDSTLQNPGTVTISVSPNPPLRDGDVLTMTVDGAPVDGASSSMTFTMSPVNRGTHTVGINIANTFGTVVCSTTSVFHVMQPGMNSPARQQPPPRPRPPPRPTPH